MVLAVKLAYFVINVVLPLVVGYGLRRFTALKSTFFDKMIVVNLLIIYPVLTALSFWRISISPHLLYLPILGVVMNVVPAFIAYIGIRRRYTDPLDQGSYMLSAILSNTLTLGGLVAFIIYGEPGYAYTVLLMLLNNVVLFCFCFPLAQYYHELSEGGVKRKIPWKKIIWNRNQIPTLSIFVGLGLSYGGITRPPVFDLLFQILVQLGAWTALLPVGFTMDFGQIRHYWRRTANLVWIKFLATPFLLFLLAYPIIHDPVILYTVMIIAGTPTAINAVLVARLYRLNVHIATASFVLTTGLYLLIVAPCLFWLLVP